MFSDRLQDKPAILNEEAGGEEVERSCDTLFMCIVTTLNKGLRNGGGIGDVLRQPSIQVCFLIRNIVNIWTSILQNNFRFRNRSTSSVSFMI